MSDQTTDGRYLRAELFKLADWHEGAAQQDRALASGIRPTNPGSTGALVGYVSSATTHDLAARRIRDLLASTPDHSDVSTDIRDLPPEREGFVTANDEGELDLELMCESASTARCGSHGKPVYKTRVVPVAILPVEDDFTRILLGRT